MYSRDFGGAKNETIYQADGINGKNCNGNFDRNSDNNYDRNFDRNYDNNFDNNYDRNIEKNYQGIRSEGQLYNLEREYNEARAREEHHPEAPPSAQQASGNIKRGFRLDFLRDLKLDDLILIGIGLLLLLDSDGDNDIFVLILAFLLMF